MKLAKNLLSIFGIILGVLALTNFIMLPVIYTWFPVQDAIDLNTIIPTTEMIKPSLLFDFKSINFANIGLFGFGEWARLGILAGLAIFAVLFIIWFISIIVKKEPVQLVWWFLALVAVAASADVIMCFLLYSFKLQLSTPPTVSFLNELSSISTNSDEAYFISPLFLTIITAITNKLYSLLGNSPVIFWDTTVIFFAAALSIILLLVAVFLNFAYLKSITVKTVYIDEYVEEEETASEEPVEEPTIETAEPTEEVVPEPTPVLAEAAPAPVMVEKVVEQPKQEKTMPVDSSYKIVRRILVHKTGKVIRVLNEHYYDVTTNIFVEPGFGEPLEPFETEQEHYEKLINARGGVGAVKEEKKEVPAPVSKVEETVEQQYERISFEQRIKTASKDIKNLYNELKSEIMSYGVKSRVAAGGDTFRLHTKTYVKMTIAGKSIKLYLALDPKEYKGTTLPFQDASHKNMYKEIPFVFKVKSELSVRRAKQLIADVMAKDKLVQDKVEKRDWVADIK